MPTIARSTRISAPPEVVYPELVDLQRLTRWSTITRSHEGPDVLEVGQEFQQRIHVAGLTIPTRWRCVELEPGRSVAYEATAALGGRLHMRQTVTPAEGGCDVGLVIDYAMPGGPLGALFDRLHARARNERDAEASLQNLKDLVEGPQ